MATSDPLLDALQPVVEALGGTLEFWRVAVKPGKPFAFGQQGGKFLFGLPGNPVSALVCAHLFLMPALRAMSGLGKWPVPTRSAVLAEPVAAPGNGEIAVGWLCVSTFIRMSMGST
mgnify:CR=1 FL=1